MNTKPKIFIGSASETIVFASALEYELRNDAITEVWDYDTFRPGHFTLEDLTRKATEVNFAAFILGQDDKTETRGQLMASPRDNVIYEAGLFAGHLGVSNVFLILDSRGTKIPSDWKGLGCLKFNPESETQNEIIHKAAIEIRRQIQNWHKDQKSSFEQKISGYWWQFVVNNTEGSVISLLRLMPPQECVDWQIKGEAWTQEGKSTAIYWSRAIALDLRDKKLFYYWEGKHPYDKSIPSFFGVGEILFDNESVKDSLTADGWYSVSPLMKLDATVLKSTKYFRASEEDVRIMEGSNREAIEKVINMRLTEWRK